MNLSDALEIACRTDTGVVRSHNEDAVHTQPSIGLAILADGMGGYNAGEIASGMASTLLGTELENIINRADPTLLSRTGQARFAQTLESEITRANGAIYQAAQSQPQYAGMGTTLVVAVFFDNTMTVAHVGDSRLYRLRGETFCQITRDHSLLQEQIDSGLLTIEQARHAQNKNLVTRAVGVEPAVEVEIHHHDVDVDDIYLLCSDGLNDMIEDEEIGSTLRLLSANLGLAANQLVDMANDHGGRDNVSVILVRIKKAFPAPRGVTHWFARLLARLK
jgi:serine/threonine protein phosphatase PrpC